MPKIKAKILGADSLSVAVDKLIRSKRKKARKSAVVESVMISNEAKKLILKGPKTGKMYGSHQSSSPGEPPATDTGALVAGISQEVSVDGAKVKSSAPYSAVLEFGGRKMFARPFMRPAIDNTEKERRAIRTKILRGK